MYWVLSILKSPNVDATIIKCFTVLYFKAPPKEVSAAINSVSTDVYSLSVAVPIECRGF